jgi:glycosyltransferase involved in cell wall biosynthesis
VNILYLSYTGLAEPLGQSQVLGYLKILSRKHAITLLTFERAKDTDDRAQTAQLEEACFSAGIKWKRLRYHHRPRWLATVWDLLVFLIVTAREVTRSRPDIIHARSYFPSLIAAAVGALFRVPFIFDMRGFWPEELIVSGRLKRDSWTHAMIAAAERFCLRRAAAVVSLTQAAVSYMLARKEELGLEGKKLVVIPTCADLRLFHPDEAHRSNGLKVVGTAGTILSGWFRFPWLASFFRAAQERDSDIRLDIVTRDDERQIRSRLAAAGVHDARLTISSRSPAEVAAELRRMDALVMFFETGLAKLASCPTRMAEALGCGLPVIGNAGVGDVADIIISRRVGVIVSDPSPEAMATALAEIDALLADSDLGNRCRATAEELFSVETGAAAYDRLYAEIAKSPKSEKPL